MATGDDLLPELVAGVSKLIAACARVSNGQIMTLAGTVDDPDSFDKDGGKSGALGYYPIVDVNDRTIYFPCLARIMSIALGGANAEVLDSLIAQVEGRLTAADAATTDAKEQATAAHTQAERAKAQADAIGNIADAVLQSASSAQTAAQAGAAAVQAQADIVDRIGGFRARPLYGSQYIGAITDATDTPFLAFTSQGTTRLALTADSIIPDAAIPTTTQARLLPVSVTARTLPRSTGYLYAIVDESDAVLSGYDLQGRLVANLSPKSVVPTEAVAPVVQSVVDQQFAPRMLPGGVSTRAIDPAGSGWLYPLTDASDGVFAGLDRFGQWVCYLSERSIIPSGLIEKALAPYLARMLPIGAAEARAIVPISSGWLFVVTDLDDRILFGLDGQGRLVANLSPKSIIPGDAAGALDAMKALLATSNMGIPAGRLFFSGDSMTAGAGGAGTSYPSVMAAALGLPFVTTAVGGTRSDSIGVRQGGIAMLLSLSGGALPADTSEVDVSAYSIEFTNNQGSQAISGTLGGVAVQLRRYSSASPNEAVTLKYTVRRLSAASSATPIADASRFLSDAAAGNEADHHYIWAGRNDPKNTRAARIVIRDNILRMVDRVRHDRFAVLTICNGTGETKGSAGYDAIMDSNRLIREAVSTARFMDQRSYLASYDALSDAGITPTAQDDSDVAGDTIPASLRSDAVHGTATFYTLLGQYAARWHRGRGWATGI